MNLWCHRNKLGNILFQKLSWEVGTILKVLCLKQSYEIKSPPWNILWFRIVKVFSVENIKRLCVFMFQT